VLLQIGALRSAEALANLNTLSFGARKQIGVISLADADLLQEAGRPTLIILDDVLEWGRELTASVTGWVEGMFAADASGTANFRSHDQPHPLPSAAHGDAGRLPAQAASFFFRKRISQPIPDSFS
jgi:hypothetical protein